MNPKIEKWNAKYGVKKASLCWNRLNHHLLVQVLGGNLLPNGELLKPDMEKGSRPTLRQKEGRGIAGPEESEWAEVEKKKEGRTATHYAIAPAQDLSVHKLPWTLNPSQQNMVIAVRSLESFPACGLPSFFATFVYLVNHEFSASGPDIIHGARWFIWYQDIQYVPVFLSIVAAHGPESKGFWGAYIYKTWRNIGSFLWSGHR